jgi:hypothetical protein
MSTLNNIRRAELKRLLRHRGVSDIIVHNEVEDILAERIRWTSTALGERMQLSFKERDHLGIRTIACIDLSKKMVREYYLRRKRERDRVRAYRMRAQVRKAKVSPRATQLAAVVKGDWTPIAPLAGILQKRNGWPRKHDAAAKALRRAALELSKAELGFELKTEPGPRGGYLTLSEEVQQLCEFLRIKVQQVPTKQGLLGQATQICPLDSVRRTKTCRLTEEMLENGQDSA